MPVPIGPDRISRATGLLSTTDPRAAVGAYFIDLILTNERQTLERIERAGRMEVVFADLLGTGRRFDQRESSFIVNG